MFQGFLYWQGFLYYPPQTRNLKSEVSLDAEGYPQLLSQSFGAQSKKPCAGLSAADCAAMATCDEELAQAAMGQLSASSRAAANQQPEELMPSLPLRQQHQLPQAKPKAKAKAKAKGKANSAPQDALISSVCGRLCITRGTCKSYIQ